jgi:hypothetical protein
MFDRVGAQVAWGLVTQISPDVQVRFAGDTTDVTVSKKASGVTLAEGDRVKLSRVGAQWIVDYVIGDV